MASPVTKYDWVGIYAMRRQNTPWSEIADMYGVSSIAVRQAYSRRNKTLDAMIADQVGVRRNLYDMLLAAGDKARDGDMMDVARAKAVTQVVTQAAKLTGANAVPRIVDAAVAEVGNSVAVRNLLRRWLYDRLRPYQQDAIYGPENRKYLEFYPQSGKTEAACSWLTDQCLAGEPGQIYWWLSGVYDQSVNAWRRIRDLIAEYNIAEIVHREIRFHNGPTLKFMSAGSGTGNFGDSVSAMVIDESSDISDEAWAAAMSRTTATNGPMRIIGNRRGRGRFYQECREAENRADGTLTMLTGQQGVELGLWTQDAYEAKKLEIAPALFSELYDLYDVDAMNPFVGYEKRLAPLSGQPTVCFGVDIARYPAYYAMIGLDDGGAVSYENAWRGQAYETSAAMVKEIAGDLPVLVDATGAEAHMEQLRSAGVNAWPYHFTTPSRQELLERLAVGIASEKVTITAAVQQQMQRFEIKHGPAGVRYETPVKDTIGDDRVMALALAWWLHDQGTLTYSRRRR